MIPPVSKQRIDQVKRMLTIKAEKPQLHGSPQYFPLILEGQVYASAEVVPMCFGVCIELLNCIFNRFSQWLIRAHYEVYRLLQNQRHLFLNVAHWQIRVKS